MIITNPKRTSNTNIFVKNVEKVKNKTINKIKPWIKISIIKSMKRRAYLRHLSIHN